jgi:hypothetical protein
MSTPAVHIFHASVNYGTPSGVLVTPIRAASVRDRMKAILRDRQSSTNSPITANAILHAFCTREYLWGEVMKIVGQGSGTGGGASWVSYHKLKKVRLFLGDNASA